MAKIKVNDCDPRLRTHNKHGTKPYIYDTKTKIFQWLKDTYPPLYRTKPRKCKQKQNHVATHPPTTTDCINLDILFGISN